MSDEPKPAEDLEILAVKLFSGGTMIVDFSDGTSAFYSAAQLAKSAQNRMKTANWPEGRTYHRP